MKYTIKVVQKERGITISDITIGYDLDPGEVMVKIAKIMATHGLRGSPYQGDVVIQPQPQDISIPACEEFECRTPPVRHVNRTISDAYTAPNIEAAYGPV